MSYIIEKIPLYENNHLNETNIVIKNNRVYSRDTPVRKMNFIRLQLDKRIMIAGETVFGCVEQWQKQGIRYAEKIILLGATTVVFPIDVKYEYQLTPEITRLREVLSSFPLDYVIVLRIPLSLVRPSIVRYCKKHAIPAIITTVNEMWEIERISWSWIREAIFPYKLAFIPQFTQRKDLQLKLWSQILSEEKIAHFSETISIHQHLTKDDLKKIGLYPFKGIIRSGGEVTYNLIKDIDQECLINKEEAYYDKIELTVFKNKVIRAGNCITLPSHLGQELIIKVPGYFQ